ncbi:MAG: hypothetical protein QM764_11400 [Chitinophagaceae bacterium]
MAATGTINYRPHHQIDKKKWDACIDSASNGLIYAYSFYLDQMAKQWDALVLGDYEIVMPLTCNRKYGFHYLYQPPFVACGGIFGQNINPETEKKFIATIPAKFKLIEVSLNYKNKLSADYSFMRNNHVLSLNHDYDSMYKDYHENIKRNIKKSQQAGCYHKTNIAIDEIIALNKEQLKGITKISDKDYSNFRELYNLLYSRNQAITYGVYNKTDELMSSSVFFFSHKRAYYILAGNNSAGKTIGASHYLIDRFIYDNSTKDLLLDFEGSDIPSLALFYSGFGASIETYPAIKINRLPWPIKLLK